MSFSGGPTDEGAAELLLKQAVAALLNASHPEINYPLNTSQVISQVNAALATSDSGQMLDLKDQLDQFNNLGSEFCGVGDANCDGKIDAADVLTVLDVLSGVTPAGTCLGNADVNHDGRITAEDGILLLEYWAGLINGLPGWSG